MSRLSIVGIGPGNPEELTPRARRALEEAERIVGYHRYVEQIRPEFPDKQYYTTGMRGEMERVNFAVDSALEGVRTVVVSSGDASVYGMASLALETAMEKGMDLTGIEVIPGITAALSCGAVLGSPLSCDFAVISLSDQLVPWERIAGRLDAAASGDLPLVLYNPGSRQRKGHLERACGIIRKYKAPDTVCAVVRNAGRVEESYRILSLTELEQEQVDMVSTVFIGSAETRNLQNRMVTPRGYQNKYRLYAGDDTENSQKNDSSSSREEQKMKRKAYKQEQSGQELLIFGGTSEGRTLAEIALESGYIPTVSVVSEYGREAAAESAAGIRIVSGRMPEETIRKMLSEGRYVCVIDATHPYAKHISKSITRAASAEGIRRIRISRITEGLSESRGRSFTDMESIIRYLNEREGNVFFATGSNASQHYAKLRDLDERGYIRILPSEDALAKVRAAGFRSSHILCMQGPFSEEMNAACYHYAEAEWLVTKVSGREGGFDSKISAAEKLGLKILLLTPPEYKEDPDEYTLAEAESLIREKEL